MSTERRARRAIIVNIVGVTLLAKEQLPLEGKILFHGVAADERVETRLISTRLRAQNPPCAVPVPPYTTL